MEQHDFGWAVRAMSGGKKVSREGWNGKGMFIFLIAGECWEFTTDIEGVEDDKKTLPFFCMKTADDKLVPWLCSQTDAAADDWNIVD